MDASYRKDLSHTTWQEVFDRQSQRAHLFDEWLDWLELRTGARVLDVGSGPGFGTLLAASRVGPTGHVLAVDSSADALAHLERLQRERGVQNVSRLVADAATAELGATQFDAALVTMVLHHADDPAGLLQNVARHLAAGTPIVVAEFHPDGPGESGPPRDHRLDPDQVRGWCEAIGLRPDEARRQTPEHYAFVARRGP